MKDLNLDQLLRYGFAGVMFLFALAAAFEQPWALLTAQDFSAAFAVAASAVTLTIGCVIYALHRAVLYLPFYRIFRAAAGRHESPVQLDIQRWRHLAADGTLQSRLGEWAAQLHFLYCVAWATIAALLLGHAAAWRTSVLYGSMWFISVGALGAAAFHHYRYQCWEREVFRADADALRKAHIDSANSGAG
jgi:hypothetical protein